MYREFSLVAGSYSWLQRAGFSVYWLFSLWSTSSGALGLQELQHVGSVVTTHWLSCSVPCRIFPDQGSNLCFPHWQAILYYWATREVSRTENSEGHLRALPTTGVWLCCRRYGCSHQMAGLLTLELDEQETAAALWDTRWGWRAAPRVLGCCCSCMACSGGCLLQGSHRKWPPGSWGPTVGFCPWMLYLWCGSHQTSAAGVLGGYTLWLFS